jgi:predicted transcriptional regulator
MVKAKSQVPIELAPKSLERLMQVEQAEGRSAGDVVEAVILRHIEAAEHRAIVLARSIEFEKARLGVPHEEMEAWVDSWDTDEELPCPEPRPV